MMINGAELAEAAIAAAGTTDLDECIVIVADDSQVNLRWANNVLTTNGQMRSVKATVIGFAICPDTDGKYASASVGGAVAEVGDITKLVTEAAAAIDRNAPAEDSLPLITPAESPVASDFAEAAQPTDIAILAEFATGLGQAFGSAAEQDAVLFGFAEHQRTTTWLASTTGLRLRHVQPTGRLELNAKSADFALSAWVAQATPDFRDVDIAAKFTEVITRLGWAERKIDLPAGRYETLLPPTAVADLMIYLLWSASAREAEEGRNAFAAGNGQTKINQRLSELPLTLACDPTQPGIAVAPFVVTHLSYGGTSSVFDNGMPLNRVNWLTDGVLTNLNRTRATAHGANPVSAGANNLIMTGDSQTTLDEMIRKTKRGLLLTCLWYIREVDPQSLLLTGLTRDGVYLIEDGKIVGAVNNFRFNESPVELLGRITETSAAEKTLPREWNDYFTQAIMPAVRVPDFNMSTVSQAS